MVARQLPTTENNMSSSLMRCSVVRLHKPLWLRYYSGSTPDKAIAYIYCCKSGGATFTEVEEKERSHRTRCNVANRDSRLFAPLVYNTKSMCVLMHFDDCCG